MAIAFVKNVGSEGSNATTHTVTVPAAGCALGNVLVARFATNATDAITSLVDTGTNTYTLLEDTTALNARRVVVYAATITTALVSGNTIVFTVSSKGNWGMVVDEFSGVTKTQDGENTGSSAGTTTPSSGAITQTLAADLLIGALTTSRTNTVTEDSDNAGGDTWHTLTKSGSPGNWGASGAYKITTSAVSQSYDPTISPSDATTCYITALKGSVQTRSPRNPAININDPAFV